MNIWKCLFALTLAAVFSPTALQADETVWLDSINLKTMHQGWGRPQINHSVTGQPLSIHGTKFARGVGTHASSVFVLSLRGGTKEFSATVGLDDDVTGPGSIVFQLLADGKKVFDSGIMTSNTPPRKVRVKLRGVKFLTLRVGDAGDGNAFDHADWSDAKFTVTGQAPTPVMSPHEEPYLLTPKPAPAPRINGPLVYGARPGHAFLYRIPAQGERPMNFTADNLPAGLELDASTGIISGATPARGTYDLTLHAENSRGSAKRAFKLISGDTLALTPPMGWNDWYAFYNRITDEMVRSSADAMATNGMADVGYQYVDIDDCWPNTQKSRDPAQIGPFRDSSGNVLPNKHFPDMEALTAYIHGKGLKAGIYTSPGPTTCAGFAGAYQHEAQDAQQFASWGFDFLKYDWCSYGGVATNKSELERSKQPYILMGNILKQQSRDIVFNLCQYGMSEVWKWGAEIGGNSWRTAGDLGMELDRFFDVALRNAEHRDWQKPGAWNDPDYIQIGYMGNSVAGGPPVPFPLTPTEEYSFMSLWCLMSSPLFYSGDMTHLDELTLNILCNPEVIEVDQDPLGQCTRVITIDDDRFLMIKQMSDGSVALGLGNRGETAQTVSANWKQLGLPRKERVRDLWSQKELGTVKKSFSVNVPRHGVFLARLWPLN